MYMLAVPYGIRALDTTSLADVQLSNMAMV
jgi:hypothetical protein